MLKDSKQARVWIELTNAWRESTNWLKWMVERERERESCSSFLFLGELILPVIQGLGLGFLEI